MKTEILNDCAVNSYGGKIPFPLVVKTLIEDGVEAYHVDLVRSENRYYDAKGESQIIPLPGKAPGVAVEFSAGTVSAAIKKSQQGQIKYVQFLQEIADAGCVYYITYLTGKRVIYFGRNGDMHIEHFPK